MTADKKKRSQSASDKDEILCLSAGQGVGRVCILNQFNFDSISNSALLTHSTM